MFSVSLVVLVYCGTKYNIEKCNVMSKYFIHSRMTAWAAVLDISCNITQLLDVHVQ